MWSKVLEPCEINKAHTLLLQAALSDACSASLENLFPPQFNVTAIKRDLDNAEAAVKKVVPSPLTGFTLFLPADTALSNATGNSKNHAYAPCKAVACTHNRWAPITDGPKTACWDV